MAQDRLCKGHVFILKGQKPEGRVSLSSTSAVHQATHIFLPLCACLQVTKEASRVLILRLIFESHTLLC